jgi:hypothetical protein
VQADRSSAERVRLDNVRAGFQILGVNFLDDFRLGQKKKLKTTFEIFAMRLRRSDSRGCKSDDDMIVPELNDVYSGDQATN